MKDLYNNFLRLKTILVGVIFCFSLNIYTEVEKNGNCNCQDPLAKPHNLYEAGDYHPPLPSDQISGTCIAGQNGGVHTTADLMVNKRNTIKSVHKIKPIITDPSRRNCLVDPQAPEISCYPSCASDYRIMMHDDVSTKNPQQLSLNFLGGTLAEAGAFPPDSMGAVGPSQFIMAINGIIRSFDKGTGIADGVLNIDTDSFFNSVRNNQGTSDPRIRYDRFSQRWFIVMINVANDNNRIMLATSDSNIITSATRWSFYYFQPGTGTFYDYPTLGIDANALYIGGVTFSSNDTGKVFVINKQSVLSGGPAHVTMFNNVIDPVTGKGPFCPQGVDSFDASSSVGYFIGVDKSHFGRLALRRIYNPGSANPTISGAISLTVPVTQMPINVPHKGNNNGPNGYLDAIDDRLFMAYLRNGSIWTVHNIGCNNLGVSSPTTTLTRNGSRWYQINVTSSTPTLVQSATLFQYSNDNTTDRRSFWIPSIMTSGQGHMALGCSVAGINDYINAATAGKLATDRLGSIQHATLYTANTTSYNPADDPGSVNSPRRWGDYSYVSVDPCDDMTMWTIQEYCNDTNSWGVRIVKLIAPPPATPTLAVPAVILSGNSSTDVTITGLQMQGSGFFDPQLGSSCLLKVTVAPDVIVNKVTYVNPTTVIITVSTVGASLGLKNVTVINPDGQSITSSGLITVV